MEHREVTVDMIDSLAKFRREKRLQHPGGSVLLIQAGVFASLDVIEYAEKNGIEIRRDWSNSSCIYTRKDFREKEKP